MKKKETIKKKSVKKEVVNIIKKEPMPEKGSKAHIQQIMAKGDHALRDLEECLSGLLEIGAISQFEYDQKTEFNRNEKQWGEDLLAAHMNKKS